MVAVWQLELPAARKCPPLIRLLPLGQLSDVQRRVEIMRLPG